MDQERFDRVTRALVTGQSRRDVLKGLTGTAIGGLLAAVGVGEAAAKPEVPCKEPNFKCGKGRNAQCCTSGEVCENGTCAAPPPELCGEVDCDAQVGNNECIATDCIENRCYNDIYQLNDRLCNGGAGKCGGGASWPNPS